MNYPSYTGTVLKAQYPEEFSNDQVIASEAGGVFDITTWDGSLGPKPTPEEITEQWLGVTQQNNYAAIKTQMSDRIFIHYDITEQLNIANGLYPPAVAAQFEADHQSMMLEYTRVRDAILGATTPEEVEAILETINWPLPDEA